MKKRENKKESKKQTFFYFIFQLNIVVTQETIESFYFVYQNSLMELPITQD